MNNAIHEWRPDNETGIRELTAIETGAVTGLYSNDTGTG